MGQHGVHRKFWTNGEGFFDHIAPPRATAANNCRYRPRERQKRCSDCACLPVVASPFSRSNPAESRVSALVFDHTSVLKLIEWRLGACTLLTPRDGQHRGE